MPENKSLESWAVAKRQFVVFCVLLSLIGLVLAVLYWADRQREWRLRQEQAAHRLELAFELITRDLDRVRSDILYVASQRDIRNIDVGDARAKQLVEHEFGSFLRFKGTYQQIRLIDETGREVVRVDLRGNDIKAISASQLQDKRDRYYVRESLRLRNGELFVSDFDLNQEHGVIEQPLKPVIRFVTPVVGETGEFKYLLVANYQGEPLLKELAGISLPGKTYLIRDDGQYLLGKNSGDSWGWLLGHENTFASQFPRAWEERQRAENECVLTGSGAFAFRPVNLQRFGHTQADNSPAGNQLLIVSHLPTAEVFAMSNQLMSRLLILVLAVSLPMFMLTRFWAIASVRRKQQNHVIIESEKKLRELSSRLIRIQEEERRAISREIHDQLGQQVTAINLDLKLAEREARSDKLRIQLQRAIDESEQLLDTLHDFAAKIRPSELDDLGLHDAVESHLWEFKNRTEIEFDLDSNIDNVPLPPAIAENVYRLIQESLNNVLKHANATRVNVAIRLNDQAGEKVLCLCVKDDGVGARNASEHQVPGQKSVEGSSRLGILGMQERVDLLGGTLDLVSRTDEGTTVSVTLPIRNSTSNSAV
jgi:signal transduction histidine kinase